MVDIAQETEAALMTFDYRYFGVNRPTEYESLQLVEILKNKSISCQTVPHRLRILNSFQSNKSLLMLLISPDSSVNILEAVVILPLFYGVLDSEELYRFGLEAVIHISLMLRNYKFTCI